MSFAQFRVSFPFPGQRQLSTPDCLWASRGNLSRARRCAPTNPREGIMTRKCILLFVLVWILSPLLLACGGGGGSSNVNTTGGGTSSNGSGGNGGGSGSNGGSGGSGSGGSSSVTVGVTPPTTTLGVGASQTFTATINGSASNAVNWSLT